jgi:hypothetical protein
MNRYLFSSAKKSASHLAKIMIALLFILYAAPITAQSVILKGTVKNEKGEPVPYSTIVVKGTSNATYSDLSGNFSIKLILPATIVYSCVGYESVEKALGKKTSTDSILHIDFTLLRSKAELTEVVVTSLGAVRQKRAIGYSTVSVTNKAITTPLTSSLTGKVSGIAVTSTADKMMLAGTEKETMDYSDGMLSGNRSRLLTAGELNDFKKWKMWEDYNQADFKTHSEKWQLYATDRYCVQLQNADRKAIVGESVFLLNKATGDTLWTAISDNTGKAELWNGFNKKNSDKNLAIVVNNDKRQFPPIPFTQGVNRVVVNKSCAASNHVDIAFVVDATGSMQDEINYLKEELEDVLTKFTRKDSTLSLRTGAVFYRDNSDVYITKVQGLTNDISNTIGFIKQQDAGGGGDYPEAVNDGLKAAIESLQWNAEARTRIIFLLMDAPPHDEARDDMTALIIKAAAKGIRIVPVACSGTDKATEFIMRSIALATNGSYLFLTDDSGIGNAHIKPTTDEFKVELLNDLLQRIIEQMCFVSDCEHNTSDKEPVALYTNTGKVKIFPNPTTGPVTLQTTKKLKEIYIADFTGKLLRRIQVNQKSDYHFDLSIFPAGTYFIKYITDENKAGAEKLVLVK